MAQPPNARPEEDKASHTPPEKRRQPPRLSVGNGYSIFVGTLKVILPAVAAALALLVLVWPEIVPDDSRFSVGVADLKQEEATNPRMVNPRFQGRDDRDRPFTVNADEARQAHSGADEVELTQPKADVTLRDDGWLALSAQQGRYLRKAQHLRLVGEVSLFHDHGFEMHTERAEVDLKAGRAESDLPVRGQGPDGTLHAEGFRIEDKGERIFLTGKSRLVFHPQAQEATR